MIERTDEFVKEEVKEIEKTTAKILECFLKEMDKNNFSHEAFHLIFVGVLVTFFILLMKGGLPKNEALKMMNSITENSIVFFERSVEELKMDEDKP